MKKLFLALILLCCHASAEQNCYEECCPCDNSMHFTVGADWLLWQLQQTNIGIGGFINETRNSNDPNVDWDPALVAKSLDFNFKWKNGFRVYAETDFCCSDWTIGATYTYIPTSTRVSHHQAPNINTSLDFRGVALATNRFPFLTSLPSPIVENIDARWKAHVSYLDFDVARNLIFCRSFRLTPHLGLRVLWIHQNYNFEGNTLGVQEDFEAYIKERTVGYGIEGGLWGSYDFCGFSINGHLGGACLYSRFKTTVAFFTVEPIMAGSGIEHGSILSKTKIWEPIYDVDFSLAAEYQFSACNFLGAVRIGWEQHLLFGSNHFVFPSSNMSFQGLTVGVNVSY